MDTNKQQLLQTLLEKFGQTLKKIHSGHNFPFGQIKLSRPEAMILFFMADKKDGVAIKELSKFLKVTPGAITQFTDTLVNKKIVKREEDPRDRRIISIKFTPSARKKINLFRRDYFKSLSAAFSSFQADELREFIRLLEKISLPEEGGKE